MKKQLKAINNEWQDLTDALTRALGQLRETHGIDRRRLLVDIKHLVIELDELARAAFLAYMSRRRQGQGRERANAQSSPRKCRQCC